MAGARAENTLNTGYWLASMLCCFMASRKEDLLEKGSLDVSPALQRCQGFPTIKAKVRKAFWLQHHWDFFSRKEQAFLFLQLPRLNSDGSQLGPTVKMVNHLQEVTCQAKALALIIWIVSYKGFHFASIWDQFLKGCLCLQAFKNCSNGHTWESMNVNMTGPILALCFGGFNSYSVSPIDFESVVR